MQIDRLALQGFLGYRDRCELDFSGKRTIGICGSNESGKSSILRAITYALFGSVPTPQGAVREQQLINDHCTDLLVELAVTLDDGSKLEIERGRTKSNEPVLRATGIGKTNATKVQDHISELVRVGYDDFIALSYFVQGDVHQFMSGSKRAYFQRWTEGLRRWKGYEDHATAHVKQAEATLRSARVELARCKERLSDEQAIVAEKRAARSAAQKSNKEAQIIAGQVAALQEQLAVSEASGALKAAYDAARTATRRLQSDLHRLQASRDRVKGQASSIRSGICPLLAGGIECEELQEQGAAQRKEINATIRDLTAQCKDLQEREAEGRREAEVLKADLDKSLEPSARVEAQLARVKRDLAKANHDVRTTLGRVARAEAAVDLLRQTKEHVEVLEHDAEEQAEELRRWQFVRFMCGKSGVPAMLIEGELERVEERCNWVLERLDYSKRIKFSGYKELASYERVCGVCGCESWRKNKCSDCGTPRPRRRKDEPTVTILDGEHERAFALESGGAQVLQSFAVRLAGGLFVSAMTGVPMQLIMLDEVFAHLDAVNRQALMSLVVDRLEKEFGLRQQFVVSHHDDVISVVDDILLVTQHRGSSVAEWK